MVRKAISWRSFVKGAAVTAVGLTFAAGWTFFQETALRPGGMIEYQPWQERE